MQAIIIDTETTGIDEPEPVEIAYVAIDIYALVIAGGSWCGRFKPSKPISLGAMATHHILDEELTDAPPASSFQLPEGVEYIIGHNVDYDWRAIGEPPVKRIDTCSMCRHLWPDADRLAARGGNLYQDPEYQELAGEIDRLKPAARSNATRIVRG